MCLPFSVFTLLPCVRSPFVCSLSCVCLLSPRGAGLCDTQERFDKIDKIAEQRFDELKKALARLNLSQPGT